MWKQRIQTIIALERRRDEPVNEWAVNIPPNRSWYPFQLICACEIIRRSDETKWGKEPFRVGLWVGQKTTPNTTEAAAEAIQQEHGNRYKGRGSGSPVQLTNCPWCGSRILPGRDIKVESYAKGRCRTISFCGDELGRCSFSARNSPLEGIPVVVVDEEIYRRLPTLLIATVDKFAQMPWNGRVQMLFGQVEGYCPRHGFRSPSGLDARDNFFALQRAPGENLPGRRYIGICAPGRRLKVGLIRVYIALLSAAQSLYEKKGYGEAVDPWLTLVGYFNSMRELGGMRRLVDDDVRTRLGKMKQRGLSRRTLYSIDELTLRKDSTDIPEVLDHLEVGFDPQTEAKRKVMVKRAQLKDLPKRPLDVLLATNMLSVGVDVQRLGLMVVGGQPKTTAEYIQATSRVGRRHPGLVFTVYNWTRPRDLSHYERFEHYHATFCNHFEALSVTPFASGALSRGLTALLVSCVRLQGTEFNANQRVSRIDRNHPYVKEAIQSIVRRAELVGSTDNVGFPVAPFPRWQMCTHCRLLAPIQSRRMSCGSTSWGRRARCPTSSLSAGSAGRSAA